MKQLGSRKQKLLKQEYILQLLDSFSATDLIYMLKQRESLCVILRCYYPSDVCSWVLFSCPGYFSLIPG